MEVTDKLGRRYEYSSRVADVELRKRAMAAAKYAIDNNLTREAAAKEYGITNTMLLSCAILILKNGTEEEIEGVASGRLPITQLSKQIRLRLPPDQRNRKAPARTVEQDAQVKSDAAIWRELRDALNAICGLPRPSDVIKSVRRHSVRKDVIDKNIMTAFTWLTEFSDAWTK